MSVIRVRIAVAVLISGFVASDVSAQQIRSSHHHSQSTMSQGRNHGVQSQSRRLQDSTGMSRRNGSWPRNPHSRFPSRPPEWWTNPNGLSSASSSAVFDPFTGQVHENNTVVLNSANSPGRIPLTGTKRHYRYWDGSRWVTGVSWIGVDGMPHGEHHDTVMHADGSTSTTTTYRSAPKNVKPTRSNGNR